MATFIITLNVLLVVALFYTFLCVKDMWNEQHLLKDQTTNLSSSLAEAKGKIIALELNNAEINGYITRLVDRVSGIEGKISAPIIPSFRVSGATKKNVKKDDCLKWECVKKQ